MIQSQLHGLFVLETGNYWAMFMRQSRLPAFCHSIRRIDCYFWSICDLTRGERLNLVASQPRKVEELLALREQFLMSLQNSVGDFDDD